MPSARHSLKDLLLLLIAVAVFTTAAAAQEVQIMVNGPWAYVPPPPPTPPAPGATFILATPVMNTHAVFVFSGEDAHHFPNTPTITSPGAYTLALPSPMKCDLIPPKPSMPEPTPFALTVTSAQANDVITGQLKNGFAITLPQPCYTTNFADSRSRIDLTKIDTDPHKPPAEAPFTTWRVLHYSVNLASAPTATLTAANGNTIAKIPFQKNDPSNVAAISIVMGPTGPIITDPRCDSRSVDSFLAEGTLFNQTTLQVQFPRLLGETQSHDYKPECINNAVLLTQAEHAKVLRDIGIIELFLQERGGDRKNAQQAFNRLDPLIRHLKPPQQVSDELQNLRSRLFSNAAAKTAVGLISAYTDSRSVGAADCRAAQLDVTVQP